MNKAHMTLLIIVAFTVAGWSNRIIETRREVQETEPVKISGIDYDNERVENVVLTVVRDEAKSNANQSGDSEGVASNETSEDNTEEVVSVSAKSFVKATRILQTYMDKEMPGGHIKYIIVGEDIAKDNIRNAVDFITRNQELRLGSSVYIAKNTMAKEFLKEATTKEYKLSDKINNMERATKKLYLYSPVDLSEVLKLSIGDGKAGVIPSLEVVDYSKQDITDFNISTKKEDNTNVFFGGYAVIKDSKLIGYLDIEMSRGYNFVKNTLRTTSIDTKTQNGERVNLVVTSSKTKIDFEFNGDDLSKIIVKTNFKSNFTEVDSDEDVFTDKNIEYLENAQSDVVKAEIYKVIKESQALGADFLDLKGSLYLSHPYKYKKLEDKWEEIFKTVPIEVKVESRILRTYDIIETTSKGE